MVTVDTSQAPQPGLKMDALTHLDISNFTQSELHSLSLCSSAAFDLNNTDDLVIPNIDHSLFNDSDAKVLTRPRSSVPGARRPRLPKRSSPSSDHHRAENKCIVNFLKQLINENQNGSGKQNSIFATDNSKQIVVYDQGKNKRKRSISKDKGGEIDQGVEFEVLNVNGVAVDFAVLETADDLYGAELRKRTAGSETEEDGLGFFRRLEGEWCSRRKKRRIVDASIIGDWLPIGWKLVLALRRRDGRFSVYCRTYLSFRDKRSSDQLPMIVPTRTVTIQGSHKRNFNHPSGLQFPSCKDVARYLQSPYGFTASTLSKDQGTDGVQHASNTESGSQHADSIHKPDEISHSIISNSPMPNSLPSEAHGTEVSLVDIDNLPEVQVIDTFECRNCNMTFSEKEAYMQHLMSYHRKATRRLRLGSSVGDGVIIKDGKFECHFCHKVFLEKRRYNCHVGIHARTNVRKSQELRGHPTVKKKSTKNAAPSQTAKLDALLHVAETSFLETPNIERNDKHEGGSVPDATRGGNICDAKQKTDEVGLEERKVFQSLADISKDIGSNATMEKRPIPFIRSDMSTRHQLTSVCVWCRSEFDHEAIDLESLTDSIGFMCSTCKAKISGHLDTGLSSMNSHRF